MQFLRPLVGCAEVEVVLRSGSQAELLRGLDALSFDVVLTNLAPPRDAAAQRRCPNPLLAEVISPDRLRSGP